MSISLSNRTSARGVLPLVALSVGIALSALNLAYFGGFIKRGAATVAVEAPQDAPAPSTGPGGLPSSLTLTEAKIKTIGIHTEPATLVTLPTELGVPGRIEANQEREVQIRPRAAGVIRSVNAVIGQTLKKGQSLAVLDSADIGTARLNLRDKQRALATARYEADWKKQTTDNVAALIPELRKRVDAPIIEKQFADRPLGSYRKDLLMAYAKFDIAAHEEEKTLGLRKENIVGEHPVAVAVHNREAAQAEFEGVVEQAKFDARQQANIAARAVRAAEEAVIDAAQRLRILGVAEDMAVALAASAEMSAVKLAADDVTAYDIAAPFDGTVIARTAVVSQKAEMNDSMFTIADLSSVWVMVNIPESDFALLPSLQKGKIRVAATAYPGKTFDAKLLSVGATVDATTRTVPMIAEMKNVEGLLKLGMFVRIALDTSVDTEALTVPSSAVVDIEGIKGVFMPDPKNNHTFAFKTVKAGRESGDRRVITSGLSAGDEVVSKGAFALKSELILQNEKDED